MTIRIEAHSGARPAPDAAPIRTGAPLPLTGNFAVPGPWPCS